MFWEIDPSTLRVCDQGVDVLEWPTVAVTPEARRAKSKIGGPKVDFRGLSLAATRLKVVRELLAWVRRSPGVAVLIGGSGDRGESMRLGNYEHPDEGVCCLPASARRCLEAALVNGAERVLGPTEAMVFEHKLFPVGGGSRKSITNLRRAQ